MTFSYQERPQKPRKRTVNLWHHIQKSRLHRYQPRTSPGGLNYDGRRFNGQQERRPLHIPPGAADEVNRYQQRPRQAAPHNRDPHPHIGSPWSRDMTLLSDPFPIGWLLQLAASPAEHMDTRTPPASSPSHRYLWVRVTAESRPFPRLSCSEVGLCVTDAFGGESGAS